MVTILDTLPPGLWWLPETTNEAFARPGPDVFVVPAGCPTVASLSAYAHATVILHVRGTSASSEQVRSALRLTELPDRLHRRSARTYSPLNRLSLWLAIGHLTNTPVLVIEGSPLSGRELETAGRLIRETAHRHSVVILAQASATWADACQAARWPAEALR